MCLKNENGVTLVFVMVAVGLISIICVGTLQLHRYGTEGLRSIRRINALSNLHGEVTSALVSKERCSATFLGKNPKVGETVSTILDEDGVMHLYDVGSSYDDALIRLAEIRVSDFVGDVSPQSGFATVNLKYQAVTSSLHPEEFNRPLRVRVVLDINDRIINCLEDSRVGDGVWRFELPALKTPYFVGGNVGIGTTTPQASFHVHGGAGAGQIMISGVSEPTIQASFSTIYFSDKDADTPTGVANLSWTFGYHNFPAGTHFRSFELGKWNAASFRSGILMQTNGRWGIGDIDPNEKFVITGGNMRVSGTLFLGAMVTTSDKNLKKDITPLAADTLEKVLKLEPVRFKYNYLRVPYTTESSEEIGFLAQDVGSLFPELVRRTSSGYLALSYDQLYPALSLAVRDLKLEKDQKISHVIKSTSEAHKKLNFLETRLNQLLRRIKPRKSK